MSWGSKFVKLMARNYDVGLHSDDTFPAVSGLNYDRSHASEMTC